MNNNDFSKKPICFPTNLRVISLFNKAYSPYGFDQNYLIYSYVLRV